MGEPDLRDEFIGRIVPGRSFCDVGGLWGTLKEKVTVAAKAGATDLAMVDITPEGHSLWEAFLERAREHDVGDVRCISTDLHASDVESRAGTYDVVHSSGLIYHSPNPVGVLAQYRKLSSAYLVVTSMIVPPSIRTPVGSVDLTSGQAVFVPHLHDDDREIFRTHFEALGVRPGGIAHPVKSWDPTDYAPWWWLFTPDTMRQFLLATGWDVLDEGYVWRDRSYAFLASAR